MFRRSVETFVGSVVVYVAVAACAGSGALDGDSEATGSGGLPGSSGGAPEGDGDSVASVGGQLGSSGNGGELETGDGGSRGEGGSILNPVPEAMAEDGERIVNRFRVTADGLKRSEGYHDTARDEVCSFQPTQDGSERCIPEAAPVFVGYFSDSACTVPVALVTDPAGCAPVYISERGKTNDGTCSGRAFTQIYQAGEQALQVWSNSSGQCLTSTIQPTWTMFIRGERIPDQEFATGSIQIGD